MRVEWPDLQTLIDMADPITADVKVSPITAQATRVVSQGAREVNVYVWSMVAVALLAMVLVAVVAIFREVAAERYIAFILGFALPVIFIFQGLSQKAQTAGLNGRISQLMDMSGSAERKAGRGEILRKLIFDQQQYPEDSPEYNALGKRINAEVVSQFDAKERRAG